MVFSLTVYICREFNSADSLLIVCSTRLILIVIEFNGKISLKIVDSTTF